jgi:hypothetical protein
MERHLRDSGESHDTSAATSERHVTCSAPPAQQWLILGSVAALLLLLGTHKQHCSRSSSWRHRPDSSSSTPRSSEHRGHAAAACTVSHYCFSEHFVQYYDDDVSATLAAYVAVAAMAGATAHCSGVLFDCGPLLIPSPPAQPTAALTWQRQWRVTL